MKKILTLVLFFYSCQGTQVKESNLAPIIKETKNAIESDDRLDDATKQRYVSVLSAVDSENLALRLTIADRDQAIQNLSEKLENLQKKFAESQKDAGWKNLILWAFWGFIGIFVLWNAVKFAKNRFLSL